jgi:quinohemoprotein ethanol dehydrogenase
MTGRRIRVRPLLLAALALTGAVSCVDHAAHDDGPAAARQADADWPSYGRTYSEDHYSPLRQIDTSNVSRLGLAWSLDLDTNQRTDSQPVEADGVIYTATGLSIVQAVDVRTGKLLWRYDPDVASVAGDKLKPSWGIRGLALWHGRIFVGTQDGRLIALDAPTGKLVWSVQTLDPHDESTITGAPRVFNGKVLIGYTGGDRGLGRGALNCFDAATGKFLWRFYTVPAAPSEKPENDAMRLALKTWTGEWWKYGTGGAVWNAITYDPELNRIYIGTGNAGPWNWKIRNPGRGDNLFTDSVVALDADTGGYLWHYQETPNDAWDYDSAMDIELATVAIDGKPRKVLLHAPKNGFFYVLDRETGKLISAAKSGTVNWADGIDLATGRPIERPGIRYENGPVVIWPGEFGTHTWQPMAYSPASGLVYIPAIHEADAYSDAGVDPKTWHKTPNSWNTALGASTIAAPADEFSSSLLAWDPVAQKEAWRTPTPWTLNGGTMATGGDLVFQGHIDGSFSAYDAKSGKQLWSFAAGSAVMGAPISYSVDGKQYVSVLSGPVSGATADLPQAASFGWHYRDHARRLLTFALDGHEALPPTPPPAPEKPLADAGFHPDPTLAKRGEAVYGGNCSTCHGPTVVSGGAAPDLRASSVVLNAETFASIVHDGALVPAGMPQFAELSPHDLEALRHYIRAQADAAH